MRINPLFGYREIVPLYKNNKVKLLAPGALPKFRNQINDAPRLNQFDAARLSRSFTPCHSGAAAGASTRIASQPRSSRRRRLA